MPARGCEYLYLSDCKNFGSDIIYVGNQQLIHPVVACPPSGERIHPEMAPATSLLTQQQIPPRYARCPPARAQCLEQVIQFPAPGCGDGAPALENCEVPILSADCDLAFSRDHHYKRSIFIHITGMVEVRGRSGSQLLPGFVMLRRDAYIANRFAAMLPSKY